MDRFLLPAVVVGLAGLVARANDAGVEHLQALKNVLMRYYESRTAAYAENWYPPPTTPGGTASSRKCPARWCGMCWRYRKRAVGEERHNGARQFPHPP